MKNSYCLPGILLLVLAALSIFTVFLVCRNYFLDDAYIGFSYLENLYDGNGLIFEPGVRVEGLTNSGWIFFLAIFAWIAGIHVVTKVVSLVLMLITMVLVYRSVSGSSRNEGFLAGAAAVACTAFSFDVVFFSISGMETPLIACMLILILYLTIMGHVELTAILLGLAFAVRPETVLIAPVWLGLRLIFEKDDMRRTIRAGLLFTAVIILIEGLRFSYYGEFLPNTYLAKPSRLGDILGRLGTLPLGLSSVTNISRPFSSMLMIGLEVFGIVALARRKGRSAAFIATGILLAGLIFAVYARPDWTGTGRYYAPYLPVGFALAILGAVELLGMVHVSEKFIRVGVLSFAGMLIITGSYETLERFQMLETGKYPWFVMTSEQLRPAAEWIASNVPEGSSIASRRIGCLAYYSGMDIFDYKHGLTDGPVADLVHHRGEAFEEPTDPGLAEVWVDHRPEYLLADDGLVLHLSMMNYGAAFDIHGITYIPWRTFPLSDTRSWILCRRA